MPPKPWALICPASRGIGFAITRRILKTTRAPVVATARRDLEDVKQKLLKDLPGWVDGENRLRVLGVDVTDESTIASAAQHCQTQFPLSSHHHLHLAFFVPGVLHAEKSPAQIDFQPALSTFATNVLGPMLLLKHFHPFLPRKIHPSFTGSAGDTDGDVMTGLAPYATTAVMSARVGSVSDNRTGGWYSYRCSKAAVNQLVKTFDLFLRNRAGENAMAVALHPGTVKTDFSREYWASTRPEKLFSAEFTAERLVDLCCGRLGVGIDGRGRLWDWDGKEVPP